jgi:phosphatidylinositol 4-kinase B
LLEKYSRRISLHEFFGTYFKGEKALNKARRNFTLSLAAYSLLCYFL